MRHSGWIRALGISLAAAITLMIGGHSAIRAGQPSPIVSSATVGGAFGGAAEWSPSFVHIAPRPNTKEAAKIWLKLQEKVPMAFPNASPLEDVLNYVRQSTIDKTDFPDGLPIYLNPVGLQQSDKTPKSAVAIELKGIPLATSLKLLLEQVDMGYWIHPDGLLIITNRDSEDIAVEVEVMILEQLSALRQELNMLREDIGLSRGVPMTEGSPPGPVNVPPPSKPGGGMSSKGGMM